MTYALAGISSKTSDRVFVLHFIDKNGRKTDIPVGMDNLISVSPELQRLCVAEKVRLQHGGTKTHGTWQEMAFVEPSLVDVQTLPMFLPPSVCLVFDRNTPNQMAYRVSPDVARRIAENLSVSAGQCDSPSSFVS